MSTAEKCVWDYDQMGRWDLEHLFAVEIVCRHHRPADWKIAQAVIWTRLQPCSDVFFTNPLNVHRDATSVCFAWPIPDWIHCQRLVRCLAKRQTDDTCEEDRLPRQRAAGTRRERKSKRMSELSKLFLTWPPPSTRSEHSCSVHALLYTSG